LHLAKPPQQLKRVIDNIIYIIESGRAYYPVTEDEEMSSKKDANRLIDEED